MEGKKHKEKKTSRYLHIRACEQQVIPRNKRATESEQTRCMGTILDNKRWGTRLEPTTKILKFFNTFLLLRGRLETCCICLELQHIRLQSARVTGGRNSYPQRYQNLQPTSHDDQGQFKLPGDVGTPSLEINLKISIGDPMCNFSMVVFL